MRRRTKRRLALAARLLGALVSFGLFALSLLLGQGSDALVSQAIGKDNLEMVRDFLSIVYSTPEIQRWFFVIVSCAAFAMGTLFLFEIPSHRKLNRLQDRMVGVEETTKKHYDEMESKSAILAAESEKVLATAMGMAANAQKKLRTARRLHQRTRNMLVEIRQRKLED